MLMISSYFQRSSFCPLPCDQYISFIHFQQYVLSPETSFSTAAIQSIGKIASGIGDITDACMGGLISLLSNKSGKSLVLSIQCIISVLCLISTVHFYFLVIVVGL